MDKQSHSPSEYVSLRPVAVIQLIGVINTDLRSGRNGLGGKEHDHVALRVVEMMRVSLAGMVDPRHPDTDDCIE